MAGILGCDSFEGTPCTAQAQEEVREVTESPAALGILGEDAKAGDLLMIDASHGKVVRYVAGAESHGEPAVPVSPLAVPEELKALANERDNLYRYWQGLMFRCYLKLGLRRP